LVGQAVGGSSRVTRPKAAVFPPTGYAELLEELRSRIVTARLQAALAVKKQLILLCDGKFY
jgi:hypothetical protein